jgi:hypothetical protein
VLPSNKTIGGCVSLLNVNEYVNSSSLRTALTLNVNVCGAGVNVPVPSRTIFSPSSKSCSSSKQYLHVLRVKFLVLIEYLLGMVL